MCKNTHTHTYMINKGGNLKKDKRSWAFVPDFCPRVNLNVYINHLKSGITDDAEIWCTALYAVSFFLKQSTIDLSILNSYLILLTAFVISYKYHLDDDEQKKHFHDIARIGLVKPYKLYQLERLFMDVIDWKVYKCCKFNMINLNHNFTVLLKQLFTPLSTKYSRHIVLSDPGLFLLNK